MHGIVLFHFSPPFLFLTPSVPSPAAGLACQPILTHSPVSLSLCSEYTKHPEPLMRVNERGQMGEGDQCDHLSYVWIDSPDSPGYLGRSGLIWVDLPAFADWKMENLNGCYRLHVRLNIQGGKYSVPGTLQHANHLNTKAKVFIAR